MSPVVGCDAGSGVVSAFDHALVCWEEQSRPIGHGRRSMRLPRVHIIRRPFLSAAPYPQSSSTWKEGWCARNAEPTSAKSVRLDDGQGQLLCYDANVVILAISMDRRVMRVFHVCFAWPSCSIEYARGGLHALYWPLKRPSRRASLPPCLPFPPPACSYWCFTHPVRPPPNPEKRPLRFEG